MPTGRARGWRSEEASLPIATPPFNSFQEFNPLRIEPGEVLNSLQTGGIGRERDLDMDIRKEASSDEMVHVKP